jgi:tRNA1(Val) A37 N6-methylase TrmN6
VLVWIASLLQENPELPFSNVDQECEVVVHDEKQKFNDLVLRDRRGKVACVFELKLPDRRDGRSPRYMPVVEETQQKADALGAEYFVTWNVNSAVLWKTHIPGRAPRERSLAQYSITAIYHSDALEHPEVEQALKSFLDKFLQEFARIYTGVALVPAQPLDEGFVQTIQSYLDPLLVGYVVGDLRRRYQEDKSFANELRKWAVEDQGWTWDDSPKGLPESLERTARLACTLLVNKLVFYEAMRKVYAGHLPALAIPSTIHTGDELRQRLGSLFARALEIDYETVFTEELVDKIPFLSDHSVELWRDMINDVERYDFTRFDYEVIGRVFERLIAPDERHKLGQYFTPPNVVDLINAFCIRRPDAMALDPGCGAGTFLVRAYHRKKQMAPGQPHERMLEDLWGIDIARYPAHMSVINLAVRDLSSTDNYPRIIHDDFFKVFPASEYPFFRRAHAIVGLSTQKVETPVPLFDAVVGNPPYTRQEEMEDLFPGMKERAHEAILRDFKLEVSKRSSIHALFFLHGAAFVKEGGYLGLLTHNSWLQVDYGKYLQEFFLKNFKIVAVLEPQAEHWFPAVDVNTCVTILQRCSDAQKRDAHLAKFIQIKVPLAELYPRASDEAQRSVFLNDLVARVEAIQAPEEDEQWRVFPVRQADLWREGLDDEGRFVGAKWRKYLEAPPVFFRILERAGGRLGRLGDMAYVQRGFTTGANEFFYVRDITDDLPDAALDQYGLSRRQTRRLRLIETEDGDRYIIEAEYLRPLIKSTRDVKSLRVDPSWVKWKALVVSEDKKALRRKHVLKYILEGEKKVFGVGPRAGIPAQKPTCANRHPWYALDQANKGRFLWFMNITDTHSVPFNPDEYLADARFYNISPLSRKTERVLFGLLNCTFTFLCAELWGRPFAGRGIDSIDIKVYEVAQLPLLKPEAIPQPLAHSIATAVEAIRRRSILPIPQELEQADRRALDQAVLEALGFSDPAERNEVLEALYTAVREAVARRFRRARSVAHEIGRRARPDPQAIASQILGEMPPTLFKRFPQDFLPTQYTSRELALPPEPPDLDRLTFNRLQVGGTVLEFASPEEADFVEFALRGGARGSVAIPVQPEVLLAAVQGYRAHLAHLSQVIDEIAASRTRDRKLRERIKDLLRRQLLAGEPVIQTRLI